MREQYITYFFYMCLNVVLIVGQNKYVEDLHSHDSKQ